jgi:predicted MPP superfamily phosphohydrolase
MVPATLLSRRDALRQFSAGALLALGLWPGALRAADAPAGGLFKFVVINDTHAVSPQCADYLAKAVSDLKRQQPTFCLHVGDLTDKAERTYLELVRDAFAKLGAPTYFTPGNHDYTSDTDRTNYDAVFAGRLNYTFDAEGWQIIALDTTDGQRYDKTTVQPATLKWLDENLPKLDRRRPTIVFTHFPLAEGIKMRPLNADALLERLRDFNVQAVFNGHFHGFTEKAWRSAPITTNRCCALKRDNHDGTKEKGYFVCTARDGRITREFVEFKPA